MQLYKLENNQRNNITDMNFNSKLNNYECYYLSNIYGHYYIITKSKDKYLLSVIETNISVLYETNDLKQMKILIKLLSDNHSLLEYPYKLKDIIKMIKFVN